MSEQSFNRSTFVLMDICLLSNFEYDGVVWYRFAYRAYLWVLLTILYDSHSLVDHQEGGHNFWGVSGTQPRPRGQRDEVHLKVITFPSISVTTLVPDDRLFNCPFP